MKLVLCLLIFKFSVTSSVVKRWSTTTNWNRASNWAEGTVPCPAAQVMFTAPEDSYTLPVAIALPPRASVNSINLPRDGAIVLPRSGVFNVGAKGSRSCPKPRAVFQTKKAFWVDQRNWQGPDSENKAVPDVEKIPCIYDDVVFPANSTFLVQSPEEDVIVNSISIDGKKMESEELKEFFIYSPLAFQFDCYDFQDREDIVRVRPAKCTDKSGCLCHPDSNFDEYVCIHISREECPVPRCLSPVTPVGNCCPICGAILMFNIDKSKFDIEEFRASIYKLVESLDYRLDVHVSKVTTFPEAIQVVLADKELYEGDSVEAAIALKKIIDKDKKRYHVLTPRLEYSGPEYYPGEKFSFTMKAIFIPFLLAVLFFASLYLVFEVYENKFNLSTPLKIGRAPFVFARFENCDHVNMEFRQRNMSESIPDLRKAFDNPLFGESSHGQQNLLVAESSDKDRGHSEENIPFKTLQPDESTPGTSNSDM